MQLWRLSLRKQALIVATIRAQRRLAAIPVEAVACAVAVQHGVANRSVEGHRAEGWDPDRANIAARVEHVCEPGGIMISSHRGWRDDHSILGDDLETVLLEQAGQDRLQGKEPAAKPREFTRSGVIGTIMADTIAGDDSGAQSEMEEVAGHHALLISQAWQPT